KAAKQRGSSFRKVAPNVFRFLTMASGNSRHLVRVRLSASSVQARGGHLLWGRTFCGEDMLMRLLAVLIFICGLSIEALAAQSKGVSLEDLKFLAGEWKGEGGGRPGQAATGGFSFNFELQGKVLVRRNFSEYAATPEKPAFRH